MSISIERLCGLPDGGELPYPWFPSHPISGQRSSAREAAHAFLEAGAKETALQAIKTRARAYALNPRALDAIAYGLFNLNPEDLVTSLRVLMGITLMSKQRWLGLGGEVHVLNIRGAMLYARSQRRA